MYYTQIVVLYKEHKVIYKKQFDHGAGGWIFCIKRIAINAIGLLLAVQNMDSGFAQPAVMT
ncbi:hypothetical protein [Peribacillus muralis]|uniref:hypothetical protein n=1 Tax=Peribacillus muralis TaxID=264697 RepID=UPI0007DB1917|nr:hypothetical protein [Peribacillus muralis]